MDHHGDGIAPATASPTALIEMRSHLSGGIGPGAPVWGPVVGVGVVRGRLRLAVVGGLIERGLSVASIERRPLGGAFQECAGALVVGVGVEGADRPRDGGLGGAGGHRTLGSDRVDGAGEALKPGRILAPDNLVREQDQPSNDRAVWRWPGRPRSRIRRRNPDAAGCSGSTTRLDNRAPVEVGQATETTELAARVVRAAHQTTIPGQSA